MAVILTVLIGLRNWGIYNCRDTALGNPSAHGDGRALDVGCTIAVGRLLVRLLLKIGPARLGISVIIHNRVIYSAKSPNGRRYPGNPHTDHVHIEMTRAAANKLTVKAARRILTSAAATPAGDKPQPRKPGSRILRPGYQGADVRWLQRRLGITADGDYGPQTEARVRRWQRRHDLPTDGSIGPRDWAKLLNNRKAAA